MCLGVPGRIVSIEGLLATVDFFGVKRQVRLDLVDEPVAAGDYILNHVGYALHRIPEEEIEGTLALFDELLRAEGDLLGSEVRGAIEQAEPRAPGAQRQGSASDGERRGEASGATIEGGTPGGQGENDA